MESLRREVLCIIGLGYVGLPLAVAFAEAGYDTIGFDLSQRRVDELRAGHDRTNEIEDVDIASSRAHFTANADEISRATTYIIAVPTPVDSANVPDMTAVLSACLTIAPHLRYGNLVILESTVFPGVTEDICGPELERLSGLKAGRDFKLGYSPERINPGDKQHTLRTIVKVVSGQDEHTTDRVQAIYNSIVEAGTHRAPSIKVAEASKVIENIQRDINIALMNDLAMLFDRLGIPTEDVLRASGSKWNFLPFRPGLVGGHCIGVDPYYLIHRAAQVGYHEQMIGAGRRVNDSVARYIAQRILVLLSHRSRTAGKTAHRIAVLGVTFKENVPDIRNSKVANLIAELEGFGLQVTAHDPLANSDELHEEYGIALKPLEEARGADCVVLAVPHRQYLQDEAAAVAGLVQPETLVVDIRSSLWDCRSTMKTLSDENYWAL
jgi:UDP-N-acetyl-D-galactosamine dehydrogenase